MSRNFFLRGVRFRDPRLTRRPLVWGQYLAWCVATLMSRVGFWEPLWLNRMRIRRGHRGGRWQFMPFLVPWRAVQHALRRRTGGRSHRCEFTDPESGALYGGAEGGFMDRYFDQFLSNIEPVASVPTGETP